MAKQTNGATFEQQLFKAADKLRKNINVVEYKYIVLGLVFIKYISETIMSSNINWKQIEYRTK